MAPDASLAESRCLQGTEDEKSSRSVVRSQSAVPCVGRASAGDPHTKDTAEEATGDSGRGSLKDGPSRRVAATRDHASLPLSRKTADTTEHTLLHPQAPRTRQEFTHSLTSSTARRKAQHSAHVSTCPHAAFGSHAEGSRVRLPSEAFPLIRSSRTLRLLQHEFQVDGHVFFSGGERAR